MSHGYARRAEGPRLRCAHRGLMPGTSTYCLLQRCHERIAAAVQLREPHQRRRHCSAGAPAALLEPRALCVPWASELCS
jgi:hypothetical protein